MNLNEINVDTINNNIINKIKNCNIYKEKEGWVIDYPQFSKLADQQMHGFWPWDEPSVDNDIKDLRVNLTEQELHGIVSVLKLFTIYEMRVGDDYWLSKITKKFKRPEIQRMASFFGAVEFNSHSPFYNKINELLYLDTEDFYSEWKHSKPLSNRIKFIADCVNNENDLVSIGAFSFIEGAVLYSSFAFIKHFQSEKCGKNLLKNICSGVNLSVGDENLHAIGGATLFKTILEESKLNEEEYAYLKDTMISIGKDVIEHETAIIDIIFEKGNIKGITKNQMIDFVIHRVNLCLEYLGFNPYFNENLDDNFKIKDWFYKDINSVAIHDFFSAGGNEYSLNWKENNFGNVWK